MGTPNIAEDSDNHSGLNFYYKSGNVANGTTINSVASGYVTLDDDDTSYIEVTLGGVVSANTTGFTTGSIPLFTVVTVAGEINTVTDKRALLGTINSLLSDIDQSLGTTDNVEFNSLTLGGLTASRMVTTDGDKKLATTYSVNQSLATTNNVEFNSLTLGSSLTMDNNNDDKIILEASSLAIGEDNWIRFKADGNELFRLGTDGNTTVNATTFSLLDASSSTLLSVTQAGVINVAGLTASRLLSTDGSKNLVSSSLASWISGTTNEITSTDDGDGTITLSLPDVVYLGASGKIGRDADNLFDFSTDNQITIRTNAVNSFVLDSTGNLTINGLTTANRLLYCNGSKQLGSTDLDSWIDGTPNQITVTDGLDGTVTLSLPQDLSTTSNPTFNKLGIGMTPSNGLDISTPSSYIGVKSTTEGNEAGIILNGYTTTDISISHLYSQNNGVNVGGLRFYREGANDAAKFSVWTKPTGGSLSERFIVNSIGNIGIGTSDIESWSSSFSAIEFYQSSLMASKADDGIYMISNAYYDGAWKRKSENQAAMMYLYDGYFLFNVASSDVIDSSITWTEAFKIDNSGVITTGTLTFNDTTKTGRSLYAYTTGAAIGDLNGIISCRASDNNTNWVAIGCESANNYGWISSAYGSGYNDFHVYNSGTYFKDGTHTFKIDYSSGVYIGAESNHGLYLQSNNTTAISIDTSQNTSFSGNLSVDKNVNGASSITLDNSSSGTSAYSSLNVAKCAINYWKGSSFSGAFRTQDAVTIESYQATEGLRIGTYDAYDFKAITNSTVRLTINGSNGIAVFNASVDCGSSCEADAYTVGETAGIDTTFIDNDGNTITVTKGIITAKTAP